MNIPELEVEIPLGFSEAKIHFRCSFGLKFNSGTFGVLLDLPKSLTNFGKSGADLPADYPTREGD